MIMMMMMMIFMCGSTCFGRFHARHKEHTTALAVFDFTVGAVITGQTTTNNASTTTLQR
jgi:hypothetical protein